MKLEYFSTLSVVSYCETEARYDSYSFFPKQKWYNNLGHLFL